MTESESYSLQVTEEEIMVIVPNGIDEIWEFIDKIPYLVQKYGKKILIAYQVYTLPKYYHYGQTFLKMPMNGILNTASNWQINWVFRRE